MYPDERSLVAKHADKPFAIIGVNSDRDLEKLRPRLEEENITWRSFWNGPKGTSGPISKAWNVSGWPTIYVLDAAGVIRAKQVRNKSLGKAVDDLLAEMGEGPGDRPEGDSSPDDVPESAEIPDVVR